MISLHTHTTYSFLDGYGLPRQYADRLEEIGQTAMAITDHGNIFGHRAFYDEFEKRGLKLIFGCEMYLKHTEKKNAHITILARNKTGYKNLCNLVTLSNQEENFKRRPIIDLDDIIKLKAGLIILSGCFGTGVPHKLYEEDKENVLAYVKMMKRVFGKYYYMEIQHVDQEEMKFMRLVASLAKVKCVASLDAHYPRKEDVEFEDALLCIGTRQKMSNPHRFKLEGDLWLMDEKECLEHGYLPQELENTDAIGKLCNVKLKVLKPVTVKSGEKKLFKMAKEGAKRLGVDIKNAKYRDRYRYEISIIDKLGLHAYFVVMGQTIVNFKRQGMFIGPARGSSAGSLICYLIGITEIDPIKYDLSFERFMDINRKDYPDIDTDFPRDRREEVVDYLKKTFGEDRVGRICSFMTYRGSSVFWDLCRIYGVDGQVAKEIGQSMPQFSNDTVDMEDILKIPSIAKAAEKWPFIKKAMGLENQVRQLGKHASGYAISPVDLSKVCSFNRASEELVLSADKDEAERMGLLKLDILGLNTLDLIQAVADEVGISNEKIYRMKMDEEAVFDQFNEGNVAGIFQFEGGAVKKALKTLKIESIEDLSFINAVARPGASLTLNAENIPPEEVLPFCYKNRYFVYQEELMKILAWLKFDWSEITKFRKMVSKKKVTVLEDLYKEKFTQRLAVHAGQKEAERFWHILLRCGEYMFNKSHAVSYSVLAYISMWLKVHYKNIFVKHYLNRVDDDIKRRAMVREFMTDGGTIAIYNEERPSDTFEVSTGRITGSITAVKGIGPAKAKSILSGKLTDAMRIKFEQAAVDPASFAPWAALDDFGNKYRVGDLPQGEYIIMARIWKPKDGKCFIEDRNGMEKAYYNERYVKIQDGEVYRIAVNKYNYVKIESARLIND